MILMPLKMNPRVQHFLSDAEVWILAVRSSSQRISFGLQARGDLVSVADIDATAIESIAETPALEAIRSYGAVGRVGDEIDIYSGVEAVASSIAPCHTSRGLRVEGFMTEPASEEVQRLS